MTWEWRKFQAEDIDSVVNAGGKALISHPMGAGKTPAAVEIVKRLGAKRIMVTAPLNTHVGGWERHFKMFMPELPVLHLNAKTQDEVMEHIKAGKPAVTIVGWEYGRGVYRYKKDAEGKTIRIKKGHNMVPVVDKVIREALDWSKIPLDAAIIDESARMANRKSTQTQVVHTAKNVPIKLALSATPAGNRPEGLWSTLHFLWPERYKHFWPWVDTFFNKQFDPFAGVAIVGEKVPGRVTANVPTYIKRTEEEVHGQLPGVATHLVEVDLTPAQRKVYQQFEKDALAWLDEYPVAAALPITKSIRLRQTLLAVPSVEDEEVTFKPGAKSSKIDALMDILVDLPEGEKVVVWTHSRKIIPVIGDRLHKADIGAVAAVGGQSKAERDEALDAFKTDPDVQVLVATIPTLSEGVDGLQHVAAVEVWLSHDESYMLNKQARGRLLRPGQKRIINRYVVVARDTVETRQLGRLETTEQKLLKGDLL